MHTSIIVLSYNNLTLTRNFLESLSPYLRSETELIIVDDASTDGSREYLLAESHKKKFKLIVNSENIGAAGSRNKALSLCTGERVLLLDNDTEVKGDIIGILSDKLDHLGVDIVGMCGVYFMDYSHFLHIHHDQFIEDMLITTVPSYCMMFRRTLIDRGIKFEENTRIFGEDIDFCLSAKYLGFKCAAVCDIPLVHLEHGSGTALRDDYLERINENHVFIRNKWSDKLDLTPSLYSSKVLELLLKHVSLRIVLTHKTQDCWFYDIH